MTDLATIRQRLTQSQLFTEQELSEQLASWTDAAYSADDGGALLNWLVAKQQLTEFQAEAIAAGMAGPFMLGPYEVREHLAAGRLGHVFRALHVEFDQPVSLKVFPQALHDDAVKLARIQREARVAIQVDHPHVMRTFQIGRVGKIYFLAFEDLQGENLELRLAREGKLLYPEACRLIRQAALGLESLHESDIVHRDLRPSNLWITTNGQLKIMEFGAARDSLSFLDANEEGVQPTSISSHSSAIGNYEYTAPEQARNGQDADARSDIYSLGCCLYHALTGRPPFVEKNIVELISRHANEAPQLANWLVPQIPQPLAEVVSRMLNKTPDERFQTAGEVDWALKPFVEHGKTDMATSSESDWNPDYLEWVRSLNASETLSYSAVAETAAEATGQAVEGMTDEFSEFLDWIATKRTARIKHDAETKAVDQL